MMRFGLDYAWGHPISPAAHKAAGSSFACRYLSNDASKNLDAAEAKTLRSNGIDVVVVWETTAKRALAGEGAGAADARTAVAQATECGIPADRPIYFAVDFDETPAQAAAVASYFRGVNSVLGRARTGVYGGYWVVKRLVEAGLVAYVWQTYAWSGGLVHPAGNLYQYSNGHVVDGRDCDYNHSLTEDFGQWGYRPTGEPPAQPKPHYEIYPDEGFWFLDDTLMLNERSVVREFDALITDPAQNAAKLKVLKGYLKLVRDRVWTVAHYTQPAAWMDDRHLGQRWQELNARMERVPAEEPSPS